MQNAPSQAFRRSYQGSVARPYPGRVARSCLALAAAALLLAACAHDEKITVWTKANVSEDQRAKDLSGCKRYANAQMAGRRGVQQDVEVMNGGVNSGLKPSLGSNLGAYNDAKEYDSLLNGCMSDLGYTPVK